MAHIRMRPNGRIQFDLHLYGQRFREGTKLLATPKNLNHAKTQLKKMNAEIDLGTFQYRDYFPHSKKIDQFEVLQRTQQPDRFYPFFDTFANEWFECQKSKWKSSYQNTVRLNLKRYLMPIFGNTLYDVLSRVMANKTGDSPFVFTNPKGQPLDTHYVSQKLWYPTLKKAGLKRRRPYETRHTAAVLYITAHENPLYISQMLGHSDTRLLFEVYAPYVANASRIDGSSFSQMMQGTMLGAMG